MILYPAIDLKDGQCVRLHQGRFDRVTDYPVTPEGQEVVKVREEMPLDKAALIGCGVSKFTLCPDLRLRYDSGLEGGAGGPSAAPSTTTLPRLRPSPWYRRASPTSSSL